jgi:hypothetical protein
MKCSDEEGLVPQTATRIMPGENGLQPWIAADWWHDVSTSTTHHRPENTYEYLG